MLRHCTTCGQNIEAHDYAAHQQAHNPRNLSTSRWQQTRALVIARDHRACTRCHRHEHDLTRPLEVHHIASPQDHAPSNLRTLCYDCHHAEHEDGGQSIRPARGESATSTRPSEPLRLA